MGSRIGAGCRQKNKSRKKRGILVSYRSRLRARLLQAGPDTLSDSELLEVILSFGIPRKDTKPIAGRLLAIHGGFAAVMKEGGKSLKPLKDLADAVVAMAIVQAATKRLIRGEINNRPVLGNWDTLLRYLTFTASNQQTERYRVLFLDYKNRLLADELQERTTAEHPGVQSHLIVQRALELQTGALVLTRCNPAGDLVPSRNDIRLVREVADASRSVSITLHDLIITGNESWMSFRKCGLL